MIQVRKSEDRGLAEHGWLKSRHTFSFAEYYDEKFMGFSVLRVINEDRILGGKGFETHSHRDMEIISYVVDGKLEHKDSMGNETSIQPGEVQRMSAGTGVQHSEYNQLKDNTTHFLQIWILPEQKGIKPGYAQKSFANEFASGQLILVASKKGREGSISLNQDVDIYAAMAKSAGEKTCKIRDGRNGWVQVVSGDISVNDIRLRSGDGAAISKVEEIKLKWGENSEFLFFDLP